MMQQHNYGHLHKSYLEYHVLLTNSLAVKAIHDNIISDIRQLPSSDLFFMVLFIAQPSSIYRNAQFHYELANCP